MKFFLISSLFLTENHRYFELRFLAIKKGQCAIRQTTIHSIFRITRRKNPRIMILAKPRLDNFRDYSGHDVNRPD
jgi:hypothetical protein